MKILGIESAAMVASAAVLTGRGVMAEYTLDFKQTHSQTLLPMIDELGRMLELDFSELDAIAVSGGPGSFTGLRIGSATAKGLGLALKKPLIHVPTMDAMAYGLYGSPDLICPIMDARRDQVFTGLYRFREDFEIVMPQTALLMPALLAELNKRGERVIFLGDACPVQEETIRSGLSVPFSFAPPHLSRQRAACVAALGAVYFKEGRTVLASQEKPEYLKMAQAARQLAEAERQGKLAELAAGHAPGGMTADVRPAGERP